MSTEPGYQPGGTNTQAPATSDVRYEKATTKDNNRLLNSLAVGIWGAGR